MDIEYPFEVEQIGNEKMPIRDDILILSSSWEERCLGFARKLNNYQSKLVVLSKYDNPSKNRERYTEELVNILKNSGRLELITTEKNDPIGGIQATLELIKRNISVTKPSISIDITSFTKKHLLLLLSALSFNNLLNRCKFYHSEPKDYHSEDNEPIAEGLSSIKVIESFKGYRNSSKDNLLIIFLGYEGRRAASIWEYLDTNQTLVILPNPPSRSEWAGRTELHNSFLISSLSEDSIFNSHALNPISTYNILKEIFSTEKFGNNKYNYFITPVGTKAQTLGLFRFWLSNKRLFSIYYASPIRYREEQTSFPYYKTWLIDNSEGWSIIE